jgi:hypothetical protein
MTGKKRRGALSVSGTSFFILGGELLLFCLEYFMLFGKIYIMFKILKIKKVNNNI